MTDYQVTEIFVISNGSGREHVQMAGPGWSEAARHLARHIATGDHSFTALIDGQRYRLQLARQADGVSTLRAFRSDGLSLSLDELADRLNTAAARANRPSQSRQSTAWWRRLFQPDRAKTA